MTEMEQKSGISGMIPSFSLVYRILSDRFKRMTMKTKMLLYLGLVLIAAFGLLIHLMSYSAKSHMLDFARESSEAFSFRFARDFDASAFLTQQVAEGLSFAVQSEYDDLTEEKIKRLIISALERNPRAYASTIAFLSSKKYPQGFSPYYYRQDDDSGESGSSKFVYHDLANGKYEYYNFDWFRRPIMTGKGIWSEPYYEKNAQGVLMLTYSTPIIVNNEVVAVATVDVDLQDLRESFKNYKITSRGYSFMVTPLGKILGYPGTAEEDFIMLNAFDKSTENLFGTTLLQGILKKVAANAREKVITVSPEIPGHPTLEQLFAYDTYLKATSYYFVVPLEIAGSSLVVVAPESELLAPTSVLIKSLLAIIMLIFLLMAFMVLRVAHGIVEPVRALVKQAQQISLGNFAYSIPANSFTYELSELAAAYDRMRQSIVLGFEEVENSRKEIIDKLVVASEYKDHETGLHIRRIGAYSQLLADALGLPKPLLKNIVEASKMHDVGKIGIPDSILLKPSRLDSQEITIMQTHTSIGARILSGSNSKMIKMAATIAETHHEKWNGTGYPKKLMGNEIPLIGQIVSICDVFDALTSKRPYKQPWPISQAVSYIQEESGKSFKPALVAVFMKILPKILKLKAEFDKEEKKLFDEEAKGKNANENSGEIPSENSGESFGEKS